jgi:hypothetical protein
VALKKKCTVKEKNWLEGGGSFIDLSWSETGNWDSI